MGTLLHSNLARLGLRIGISSSWVFCAGKWNGATVAIKVVEHGAAVLAEMGRECSLSTSISHPHVVQTYKAWTMSPPGGKQGISSKVTVEGSARASGTADDSKGASSSAERDRLSLERAKGSKSDTKSGSGAITVSSKSVEPAEEVQQTLEQVLEVDTPSQQAGDSLAHVHKDMEAFTGLTGRSALEQSGLYHRVDTGLTMQSLQVETGNERCMREAATDSDEEFESLHETWMLLEWCDRGSLDKALAAGYFLDRKEGTVDMVVTRRCFCHALCMVSCVGACIPETAIH